MREPARVRQCITMAQENQESGYDDDAEEGWWQIFVLILYPHFSNYYE